MEDRETEGEPPPFWAGDTFKAGAGPWWAGWERTEPPREVEGTKSQLTWLWEEGLLRVGRKRGWVGIPSESHAWDP